LLNEAGYLLVDDERSLGKDWDSAAEQLRRVAGEMLVKIAAHDKVGVASDLKVVGGACVNCHAAHRNR
jgi:cytochrome c556